MYHSFLITSLVIGASALRSRSTSCTFQLSASGGKNGTLSQLSDGQVRTGLSSSSSSFTISGTTITDESGRSCIITRKCASFILQPKHLFAHETSINFRIVVKPMLTVLCVAGVEQFQCDENGVPTPGFSITNSDLLAYEDDTSFWACPATDDE